MTDRAGKYIARNHIVIHGKSYSPGSEVHLSHDEAMRAIAQGTVVMEPAKAPEGPVEPHPAEKRNARLEEEMAELGERLWAAHARIADLESELRQAGEANADKAARIADLEALLAQATAPAPKAEPEGQKTHGQPNPKGNAKRNE